MSKKIIFLLLASGFFLFLNPAGSYSADEAVEVFLKNLEDAVNKMESYQFTIVSENWKDKLYEKKVLKFSFKKPNLMRTDVLEGKKKGSAVVLNKEGKIRAKNSIGFRKTLRPTDKNLKNLRGNTVMNTSLMDKTARLKEHILDRACKAAISETEYEGRPAYKLDIEHDDPDDPVTNEELWIDKESFMMLKNIKYEGAKKVSDTTWLDSDINIPIENEFFKI